MIKSVHTKGATTHAAVWRALEKEKVVMKRSIMLSAVSGWLLASGGGSLLAEKGQGKLGAPGLEGALPPLAERNPKRLILIKQKLKLHPGRARIFQRT